MANNVSVTSGAKDTIVLGSFGTVYTNPIVLYCHWIFYFAVAFNPLVLLSQVTSWPNVSSMNLSGKYASCPFLYDFESSVNLYYLL